MFTEAPATGFPSEPVIWPPMAAVVFCASAGAAMTIATAALSTDLEKFEKP
jgi:uncharacterized protein (DUF1684 family)